MNVKNILTGLKNNIGLTIGVVISLGVIGYIYAGVWDAYSQQAQAAEDLEKTTAQLDRLRHNNPFPHVENINILSNNLVCLQGGQTGNGVDAWLTKLSAATPTPQPVPRSEFNAHLIGRRNALVDDARKIGVTLPDQFGFGFTRYVNQGLAPSNDPKEIALLMTQWQVIEQLTQIMLSNKVDRIETIRRATFDVPRESNSAAAIGSGPTVEDSVAAIIRDNPNEIVRVLPFEISFSGDSDSLRGILNSFASAPQFFVVRSVEATNSRATEMAAGGRPEELKEVAKEAPVPGAPAAPKAPATPPPGELDTKPTGPVIVFGLEKVQAKIRVDLVEFKPTTKPATAAAGQPSPAK